LRDPESAAGCAGFAGVDAERYDWVFRKFVEGPSKGYGVVVAQPYENRFLLARVARISMTGCRRVTNERFFRQEVLGAYLSLSGSTVIQLVRAAENPEGPGPRPEAATAVGVGLQRGSDELAGVQMVGGKVLVLE